MAKEEFVPTLSKEHVVARSSSLETNSKGSAGI